MFSRVRLKHHLACFFVSYRSRTGVTYMDRCLVCLSGWLLTKKLRRRRVLSKTWPKQAMPCPTSGSLTYSPGSCEHQFFSKGNQTGNVWFNKTSRHLRQVYFCVNKIVTLPLLLAMIQDILQWKYRSCEDEGRHVDGRNKWGPRRDWGKSQLVQPTHSYVPLTPSFQLLPLTWHR